jgi:hypothetical protein
MVASWTCHLQGYDIILVLCGLLSYIYATNKHFVMIMFVSGQPDVHQGECQ